MFILIASLTTVVATLLTLSRVIGLKRLAKYPTTIDVSFTVLMLVLFAGTLTGMMVAILSGLFMAVTMTCLNLIYNTNITLPKWRLQWPIKQHDGWHKQGFGL